MDRDVVRRIEPLSLERLGDHSDRPVVLVADDAAREMFAGELAPLRIEGVAVAVVRRIPEDRHPALVLEPPQLTVVGNIAPDEIAPLAAPCGTFGPERSRPEARERRVRLHERVEGRIDRQDVGIGEIGRGRRVGTELARRIRDDGRCRQRSDLAALREGRCRSHEGGARRRSERREKMASRHLCCHGCSAADVIPPARAKLWQNSRDRKERAP